MLGDDLLDRPRHGRIRIASRWVHFPLKPQDLALNLPLSFSTGAFRDALLKPFASGSTETFADVLERGLGRTICREFYFPYAEKIWGVPPAELDAEQARRRVSASSFGKMLGKVLRSVPGLKPKGGGRFFYPRRGFGQVSDAYHAAAVEAGADVRLKTTVTGVEVEGGRAVAVRVRCDDIDERLAARQVLSTIPLPVLVRSVAPAAPTDVLASTSSLEYRSMVLAYLVLETEQFTEYDAHYFPGADVRITRLSEPKNYGLATETGLTVLCAEIPCRHGDTVWNATDAELQTLLIEALEGAGLPVRVPVRALESRRLMQAYPIYTRGYQAHFGRLDEWIGGVGGLVTFGRQGLFAHDNTHHALAMAYDAVDCLDDRGELDRARWAEHRREFERHVVED